MSEVESVTITVPAVAPWINMNGRLHPAVRAKLTRAWRLAGQTAAHDLDPIPTPCRVVCHVWRNRAGRYDPTNWLATTKAVIDGFTDAGLWPDDDYTHVIGPDMRHGGKGQPRLELTITPVG